MFGDEIPFIDGFAYIHPQFPFPIELRLTGTDGNDTLIGGDGHDFLNGGPGIDLLIGGEGLDAYVLDSPDDIVQETGSNDPEDDPDTMYDTIIVPFSVNLTLDAAKYANIENIRYIGDADFVGVGHDGPNRLTGDRGNDTLIGMDGFDDLYGQAGDDLMDGGDGDDYYFFGNGADNDIVRDSGGDDFLSLFNSEGFSQDIDFLNDFRVSKSGNDVIVTMTETGHQVLLEDWYGAGRIENIESASGEVMVEAEIVRALENVDPTADDDGVAITEDQGASGNVLGNDDDENSDPLTVTSTGVFQGTYGSVQFFADGSYSYTTNAAAQALAAGTTVQDTFAYTVSDMVRGNVGTATANLVVTVSGRNDGPVTAADTGNVAEDGALTASGNVLANDSDVDAGSLLRVAAPGSFTGTYGTLSLSQDGTYAYTLNNASSATQGLRAGQTANDVFSYAVTDGTAQSASSLTIRVAGANDAAVVTAPIADRSVNSGTPFSFAFAANTFTDPDGDALSYTATLAGGGALPSWLSFNAATRTFSGTPAAGAGTLQVLVSASDASGATVTDQFALSVQAGGGSTVGDLVVGTRNNDVLAGTAFGDVIDGREGVDRMSGGKGDDFYFLDSTRVNGSNVVDTVVELANEGYDTVFADADYTLAANVEELRLLGDDDLDATGNALNNLLAGNCGDNTLSGGAGSDTYVYELHGGDDVIDEKGTASQTDTLRLEGMSANTVRLKQSGNNLVVDFPGRDGTVTIKNWFSSSASRVEQFVFDDGTVWNESTIRSRVGKSVKAVKDDDYCGSDVKGHNWNGNGWGHDHHDGDDCDDRDDRDDRGGNRYSSDELILDRLKAPVRFSFDAITQALGKPSGSLSARQIAERWAAVRDYTDGCCDGGGHDDSADFPSMSKLLGLGSQGNCGWGHEGSTGSNHNSNDMKCFQGLGEGFRKLC